MIKNPMAKELRTPKYKSQIIKNKKKDLEKHRQSSQQKLTEYWRLIS
jgi:hypothetical protein|tara:strand:+ start:20 stop:160 length:141 start_codon:yes stop_codon:yes gene_type:complete